MWIHSCHLTSSTLRRASLPLELLRPERRPRYVVSVDGRGGDRQGIAFVTAVPADCIRAHDPAGLVLLVALPGVPSRRPPSRSPDATGPATAWRCGATRSPSCALVAHGGMRWRRRDQPAGDAAPAGGLVTCGDRLEAAEVQVDELARLCRPRTPPACAAPAADEMSALMLGVVGAGVPTGAGAGGEAEKRSSSVTIPVRRPTTTAKAATTCHVVSRWRPDSRAE